MSQDNTTASPTPGATYDRSIDAEALPRVVFTGFTPFQHYPVNPSWVVARTAAERFGPEARSVLLDVVYDDVREFASRRLASTLVVGVGLAADSNAVRVETLARNHRGHQKDNRGSGKVGRLAPDLPDEIHTRVGRGAFLETLRQASPVAVEASVDAGEYVCNALLFWLLDAGVKAGPDAVFVHVPQLDEATASAVGEAVASAARAWCDARG